MKLPVAQSLSVSLGPKERALFGVEVEIAKLAYWQRYRGFESPPMFTRVFSRLDHPFDPLLRCKIATGGHDLSPTVLASSPAKPFPQQKDPRSVSTTSSDATASAAYDGPSVAESC
jgi:hypothetical protein